MEIVTHRPRQTLATHVDMFWHFRSEGTTHAYERVLPNGRLDLIINLRENALTVHDPYSPAHIDHRSGILLVGPRAEFDVIDSRGPQELMGVCFAPGGAAAFLTMPVGELFNQQLDLADLWGEHTESLWTGLREARSVARRFAILEDALERRRIREPRRHPAVRFALRAFAADTPTTVAEVVGRAGLSARRFIDVFTAEVGLTPKVYQRVCRFQRVVGRLYGDREPDLADVAFDCGYFDQAHFIHDFRAFAGTTPTAYLARRTSHQNHAALD